ncbi:iron-containing alcohol dehydrogenase [Salinicoccus sp. RF5]|uniref:iron-containing alcohol dehydrogenase n=1 Tax=Salinicoccus sp. RF5 TaxID=2748874 RepID=UPI001E442E0B|nr:iron-containing alcohol dehydrogenase [Salinicoccus sp. RF5]MCC4722967.1 iron-containing alcohol dehydrogenase [Salinicoccus sp. RF5]
MKLISPAQIHHGVDSTDKINDIVKEMDAKKVYILCDPILEELGSTGKIKSILDDHGIKYELSTNVMAEPSVEKGNEIIEEVRKYDPDLIIGLGGGSTLDLVKAASLIAVQDGGVENYLNLTGDKKLGKEKIPNILMPTTSGTSAEITDIAVFSTGDSKDAVTDPLMLATYAIIDPVYTYSLPPKVAAASSVDAFTHAIEAFTSVNATPITDTLATGAIEKIYNNVREGVWDAKNFEAKNELSAASIMAGLSFYNAGVAGVHALAYPLGGNFKIPHGESNAVLLPYVYNIIQKSCSNKLSKLAPIFKIDTAGKDSMTISSEIVQKLFNLVEDVGLPRNLKYYDIKENDIELLTKNALKQTRLLVRSPLELKEEVIRKIYTDAFEG